MRNIILRSLSLSLLGLAAPLVAQKLLGTTGAYAILFLILMAVMSTGSAEVIAVASIVIYDVYQVYICPFRPGLKAGQCILCGRNYRGGEGEAPVGGDDGGPGHQGGVGGHEGGLGGGEGGEGAGVPL